MHLMVMAFPSRKKCWMSRMKTISLLLFVPQQATLKETRLKQLLTRLPPEQHGLQHPSLHDTSPAPQFTHLHSMR